MPSSRLGAGFSPGANQQRSQQRLAIGRGDCCSTWIRLFKWDKLFVLWGRAFLIHCLKAEEVEATQKHGTENKHPLQVGLSETSICNNTEFIAVMEIISLWSL